MRADRRVAFLLLLCLALVGCKSADFVGVQVTTHQRFIGAVANSAVAPVGELIDIWLENWGQQKFELCYGVLSEEIRGKVDVTQLAAIAQEFDEKFGKIKSRRRLEMPATRNFAALDEALLRTDSSKALQYYDYVLGRYLVLREKQDQVYFFGVALMDGQLRIVSLGFGKARHSPDEPQEPFLYWFGYPSL